MCNAWNHPPDCNCGWGGDYYGNSDDLLRQTLFSHTGSSLLSTSETAILNRNTLIRDAKTYKIPCWWCGAKVHHHTNGYGDSVLFDSLGSPWPVHSCWADYWEGKKTLRMEQVSSPSTIEIIRRIEQFENSGRPSEYKERWVHSSHWMDSDQRRNILAKAIKQVSFIPDELTIAR